MKIVLLNELEYVEKILESGDINIDKPYVFLSLYSRYLYHEKGLRKTKIMKELDEFMSKHYPRYSKNDWILMFEKYATSAKKYPLCKCNGIRITQKEMDNIKKINNKVLEKVYFTLICLAKFYNFRSGIDSNWVNLSTNEIYNMANVKLSSIDQERRLHDLFVLELIDFPKRVDDLKIKIVNLDNDYQNDDVVVNNFSSLGNYWLMLKGEKYFQCQECGTVIKRSNNAQKYCSSCAYITHIAKTINRRKTATLERIANKG